MSTTATVTDHQPLEVVTRTRQTEARTAMALVSGLCAAGVPVRDITLVARDVDRYEEFLLRGARRYELTVAVWTPLKLDETVPNQLAQSLCTILATPATIPVTTLCRPLRLGWIPPDNAVSNSDMWPLSDRTVSALRREYDGHTNSLAGWQADTDTAGLKAQTASAFETYLQWLCQCTHAPSPAAIGETLLPVLERYERMVLPQQQGTVGVSQLGETVRGLQRTQALVRRTAKTYGQRLDDGRYDQSWEVVAKLLTAYTETVPGRRENPTAHAVDVMAANDTWALETPYVLALGLVDGEWPRPPESVFPTPARDALRRTNTASTQQLRPRAGWTERRDKDQFLDTLGAATERCILFRHTEDREGVERHPSVFLAECEPSRVDESHRRQLVSDGETLPVALSQAGHTEATTDE
ncbi:PD-(D/E)XK nuclease family protein [Haloarcula laminariae]|uniref:hypothetical protein n=1 Tax=Haloarcula laminariae TaxID=2961577 RepID=UPI002406EB61|nr:hypothetical protein [Halomicroarcula sp. FL173]